MDEYIKKQPEQVREILTKIREMVREIAPEAKEGMGYGVPSFSLNGPLVYFAGFKKHIGFYPTPSGVKAFKDELVGYKTSEGAIQFPLDKPIPYQIIEKIIRFKVKENLLR